MTVRPYRALILDMDGVLTDTATVHARAWKSAFDPFLRRHAAGTGQAFVPFDAQKDYLRHVDGRPRFEGVRAFLASRGIVPPLGSPEDPPGSATVCGLGNLKDAAFRQCLEDEGVAVFQTSVQLVEAARAAGLPCGVATSSRNCGLILERAGLAHLFDACVDGLVSARLGLRGKPEPDIFLKAAEMLGVPSGESVVVEDAVSGVQAGRAGGFRLVVGVDRHGIAPDLRAAGAHVVVTELPPTLSGLDALCAGREAR